MSSDSSRLKRPWSVPSPTHLSFMPLIIITGYPCSGKTSRACQLKDYFTQSQFPYKIHILNDEALNVSRNVTYASPNEEKKLRSTTISAVERLLTKENLVILDAMNYVSGFRYQLFCIAKQCGTSMCLLHCNISKEEARHRNDLCHHYDSNLLEELFTRYEEPDPGKRWDSPLFTVNPQDQDFWTNSIGNAISKGKILVPGLATRQISRQDPNFLHDLDHITQEIIGKIIGMQNVSGEDPKARLNLFPELSKLSRSITLAELQKYRYHFIQMSKSLTTTESSKIADLFISYLNTRLNN